MSIQRRQRKKGQVYVVHYYDTDRKRYVNRTFSRRTDAVAFESIVNLAKRRGELGQLDAGMEPLQEFVSEWWSSYGDRFLAVNTQKAYRDLLKRFILPTLGDLPLRRITPSIVVALRDQVEDASGTETARKTLALLQGVLERAVEWERLTINPVKAVKKPASQRSTRPTALGPERVYRLVDGLDDRDRVVCLLLAFAGLRPGECLALTWESVGATTLDIRSSVSFGVSGSTKTGKSRTVRLLSPLKQELDRFRLASGTRTGLVVPRADGGPWRDTDYRNWRKRIFGPAAELVEAAVHGRDNPNGRSPNERDNAAVGRLRPYDLRHSFASLLIHEGRNPAYIAEQMGHSIQTLLSTYVHIIEELRDAPRQDAEDLIRAARTKYSGVLHKARES